MLWETVREELERYGLRMDNVMYSSSWGRNSIRVSVLGRQVLGGRERSAGLCFLNLRENGSLEEWTEQVRDFVLELRKELKLAADESIAWWTNVGAIRR